MTYKKPRNIISSEKGQSLIEYLVVLSAMLIVSLGLSEIVFILSDWNFVELHTLRGIY